MAEWSGWQEGLASFGSCRCGAAAIFAGLRFVVTVDGGASAFLSDGPAPAARSRSRRILAVAPMAYHDWPSSLLPHRFVSDVSLQRAPLWYSFVASQLRDEERRLLPRNGAQRSIALSRVRGIEDSSVLGMNVVCSDVSYHFVHDTCHTGQSRTVSSLPVLDVNLEILRNADSCGGLEVDQELDGHDSAVLFSRVLLVRNSPLFVGTVSSPGKCSGAGCTSRGVCHE